MGPRSNRNAAICSIPSYCLRGIGCRHILVGGGGGSAKTGVPNQIQLFLLGYDSCFDFKSGRCESSKQIVANLSDVVDTGQFASMNMDCIALTNEPYSGQFLIVAGQDEFCALYETKHFALSETENSLDSEQHLNSPPSLSFQFQELLRIETDKHPGDDSYQKCVRLFRVGSDHRAPLKMATAGTDGYVRVWSIANVLKNVMIRKKFDRSPFDGNQLEGTPILRDVTPELEICSGSAAVDDIDTVLWDLSDFGKRITDLPMSENERALSNKFKVRSLRFTSLNKSGTDLIFVTAHNQRIRSSKEVSFLCLWMFDRHKGNCHIIRTKMACKESVSCLEVSECGYFTLIGTMGGSVAFFDTQSFSSLLFIRETHSSFVTALSFLPQRSCDVKDLGRIGDITMSMSNLPAGRCFLPGICANYRCSVVSVSVDRTIQVHHLPFPAQNSFTAFIFRLSVLASAFYLNNIYCRQSIYNIGKGCSVGWTSMSRTTLPPPVAERPKVLVGQLLDQ
uniref:Uncharacterized protein n=1 Tax=Globodera rostochiensis TaxID=31243 RepID=A0A914H7Q5_GLORO